MLIPHLEIFVKDIRLGMETDKAWAFYSKDKERFKCLKLRREVKKRYKVIEKVVGVRWEKPDVKKRERNVMEEKNKIMKTNTNDEIN